MLVPVEWLKEYIDTDKKTNELAEALTATGSEAEGLETLGSRVKNLVIGKIEKIEKHPNADRLVICQVDVGEIIQIVTGADNVREGDFVPVARVGAVLPDGTKIRSGKLRGVVSDGMLCSKEELGLEEKSAGIFILPGKDYTPGEDANEVLKLGSEVLLFDITPDRVDCLSIVGMAREVGIIEKQPVKLPEVKVNEIEKKASEKIAIKIEADELCPLYACRIIEGIKLGPSPLWMQQRLIASGMRPINNVVDITNYVMLEIGQPLHAFDANAIEGGTIIVRKANQDEVLTTLDGVERKLEEGMLLIADQNKPLALAGIMGGESSEITDETTTVLLESANFERANIRRASRKLGLRSEASSRFEKGLDPEIVLKALDRAASLLNMYASGKIYQGIVSAGSYKPRNTKITTSVSFLNRRLGIDLSGDKMKEILEVVGLEVELTGDELTASVPSYRRDIEGEMDLAEEIARIYGYDNIEATIPKGLLASKGLTDRQKVERIIARELASLGYNEIITYSFLSEKRLEGLPGEPVRLANPLSEEQAVLRTSMLPSMLKAVENNFVRQQKDLAFFEIAKVYEKTEDVLPKETLMVAMALTGRIHDYFDQKGKSVDFFDLKGTIEYLATRLKLNLDFVAVQRPRMHPGRTADILLEGRVIGYMGQIHPDETGQPVYFCQMALEPLAKGLSHVPVYKALTRFPAVLRDIALVGPESISADKVTQAIYEAGGTHLRSVELFDIYTGPQIGEGNRSLAYALVFQSEEKTLTDAEIDSFLQNIYTKMSELGFSIRS